MNPILCVHGIWASAKRIQPLVRGLAGQGLPSVCAIDLWPNTGRATIERLAEQLAGEVARLERVHGAGQVDLVGFSMGALVSRYFIQRLGGKAHVGRFVSIAGPHAGTWTAYALPFAGTRQMRPGSALLRGLAADRDPFGPVEVHCVYTPLDLMIVPAHSSILREARHVRAVPAAMHRLLLSDRRVHEQVARWLR